MTYKLVKAESQEEALAKSGLVIGQTVKVVGVRVSYAGNGRYAVMPVIEPPDQDPELADFRDQDGGGVEVWEHEVEDDAN